MHVTLACVTRCCTLVLTRSGVPSLWQQMGLRSERDSPMTSWPHYLGNTNRDPARGTVLPAHDSKRSLERANEKIFQFRVVLLPAFCASVCDSLDCSKRISLPVPCALPVEVAMGDTTAKTNEDVVDVCCLGKPSAWNEAQSRLKSATVVQPE